MLAEYCPPRTLLIISGNYRKFLSVAQKVMSHVFSAINIHSKIIKITHSSEKVCLQTLFFHKVSIHSYSLAPMRNKCVYTLSVPCLGLLLFVSGSE
jgi:hypothetical protein